MALYVIHGALRLCIPGYLMVMYLDSKLVSKLRNVD